MNRETIFISLAKWRKKPTKDELKESDRIFERFKTEGGKVLSVYWTLGRYDAVLTIDAPNEKAALKTLVRWGDFLNTETLLAIPRDEAIKMIE